jgi:hypothetical protein
MSEPAGRSSGPRPAYTFEDLSVVMGTYNEEAAIGAEPRSSVSMAPRTEPPRSPANAAPA